MTNQSYILGLACVVTLASASAARADDYRGSSFDDVWSQVASDPYARMPHDVVTLGSFFGFAQNKLLNASVRTLNDRRDLLPRFQKLLHPNGLCLAGTWNITEASRYTGMFRQGTQALFIGRASTALTNTEAGTYRAFGIAGKVFPTLDPAAQVETANFFAIEDLGGTLREHYLDAVQTNDIINVSLTTATVWNSGVGAAAVAAFTWADRATDPTRIAYRPLYPLAEAGVASSSRTFAPRWIAITGAGETPRVDALDFRDELRVASYPSGLRFEIWVANQGTRVGRKAWQYLGYIEATDDALTDSCDHRLHFSHPKDRN